MTQVGYGVPWPIDGPPPLPPLYGLLAAAEAPAAGVRIVPDVDADGRERWINGAEVHGYPPGLGDIFDACATLGSAAHTKGFGPDIALPSFGALTAHFDLTCTAWNVGDHDDFKARAVAALMAVESATIAKEFLGGVRMPANPHLADGNGTFPNFDAATSVKNGLALLTKAIGQTGRQGLIHCSPQVVTIASQHFVLDNKTGVIRTINGIVVIPDFGYSDGASPNGHAAGSGSKEWIYATGPVDLRRSDVFVMPETPAEALDRGLGATNNKPDAVTYRAERYYLADWDTELQAAVLVDLCQETC